MHLDDFYANSIFDFLKTYAPYVFKYVAKTRPSSNVNNFIRHMIKKHMEYNTIVVMWDEGKIIGVTTFNVINNGDTAFISNCVVHPKYRKKHILNNMTLEGHLRYPSVKELHFRRYFKLNNKSIRRVDVQKIIKRVAKERLCLKN